MDGLILAAGYATRLYPLTQNRPKPLLPVDGKPLIEHLLQRLAQINDLKRIFIVSNARFAQDFLNWAAAAEKRGLYPFELIVVDDGSSSNETRLGAVRDMQYVLERHDINGNLLVAAGDNLFDLDFTEWHRFFLARNSDCVTAYAVSSLEKLQRSGVIAMDEDGWATSFVEKPSQPASNWVCPALYLFKPETCALIGDYLAEGENPDLPGRFIAWLLQHRKIAVFSMPTPAVDIGTLESYLAVCRQFGQEMPNLTEIGSL